MEFLAAYGLFFAKLFTVFLILLLFFGLIIGGRKKTALGEEQLSVKSLNAHFDFMKETLQAAVVDKKALKKVRKQEKKQAKTDKKQKDETVINKPRVFVLDFEGDIKASAVKYLREEVSTIINSASEGDEVFLRLNNSGGVVHEHGLAASQLVRFNEKKIPLTVSVDKVAASGGYMMACVADKLVAAPFAIIGSIGVVAQLPNFNRLLDKAGIDFEQHTAGEYKRNVTMFGKNTDKEREHLKLQLSDIHDMFRDFVTTHRPALDIKKVGTGEYWYGQKALDLGLIDELLTSDDYLLEAAQEKNIYLVKMERKKTLMQKVFANGSEAVEQVVETLAKRRDV